MCKEEYNTKTPVWNNVKGTNAVNLKQMIEQKYPNLNVQLIKDRTMCTADVDLNRVRISIDENGNIVDNKVYCL